MSRGRYTACPLLALNDDVLLSMLPYFNALELFQWGLTCKRLYQMTQTPNLWISLARELRNNSVLLPFSFGKTIDNADLSGLRIATTKATRLRENLRRKQPVIYRFNLISHGWFKGQVLRDEAHEVYCSLRWTTTKSKYIFSIDIQEYASWRILLSPVSGDVAMVAVHHDVNEEWDVIEITFGATPKTKPKFRSMYYPKIKHLEFLGGGLSVIYTQGLAKLLNHYTGKTADLGPATSTPHKYLLQDDILFQLVVRTNGLLYVYARRVENKDNGSLIVSKGEIPLEIPLAANCATYPPDQFWTETELRPSSTDSQLTIWHRVHFKTRGEVYYASYTIDVPYTPIWSDDEETALFGNWTYRASVVANGTMTVGQGGDSLLLSRYRNQMAALTVYPRLHLPVNQSRMADHGTSLPVPQKKVAGNDIHSVRMAWDDVRGIAVLYFSDATIWVLHYA
ncbi:hypothetical protein PIIN_02212 [Serendipita indica DSM 11827]|uniref:F-box domain-containing protein n=1 Tax=Serendipita indica (strain DSM 11827) TaxID=1109443 RepID=G4TAK3_SERID|nr:hypothetical protein PIIN_02212 [Serendipita indica DSM 11827]